MAARLDIYPVSYEVDQPPRYNRWTVAVRPLLAFPQLLLVGGGGMWPVIVLLLWQRPREDLTLRLLLQALEGGLLGLALNLLVLRAWVVILLTGHFPMVSREFCHRVFCWSQNVSAYMHLQTAPYPPFGDQPYPLTIQLRPAAQYRRWTVALRLVLVMPHLAVLTVLGIAQAVVTVIAWFAILLTGRFPDRLFPFSVGVSRWSARVTAYLNLFVDAYPPFSLAAEPGGGTPEGRTSDAEVRARIDGERTRLEQWA